MFKWLVILLSLCTCTVRTTRKARGKPEPPTQKDIVQAMFPLLKTRETYYLNPDAMYLPTDVWLYLASFMDSVSLWNLSVTCNHMGALLRGPLGFQSMALKFSYGQLLDMLLGNERILGDWAKPLLTKDSIIATDWIQNAVLPTISPTPDGIRHLRASDFTHIIEQFVDRLSNISMARFLALELDVPNNGTCYAIPAEIEQYMFALFHSSKPILENVYYFGQPGPVKLFDRFDVYDLGRVCWNTFRGLKNAFGFTILAEYVLPAWRKEYELSEQEKLTVRTFLKDCNKELRMYFIYLSWALFLITGEKRKAEKTLWKPISMFLEDLGFDWKELMATTETQQRYREKMDEGSYELDRIYAVATQWRLDLVKIAKATPKKPSSVRILAGLPINNAETLSLIPINATNLYLINRCHSNGRFAKFSTTDPKRYTGETFYKSGLKRKIEENEETIRNVRQKRFADQSPGSIEDAQMQSLHNQLMANMDGLHQILDQFSKVQKPYYNLDLAIPFDYAAEIGADLGDDLEDMDDDYYGETSGSNDEDSI